MGMGMPGGLLLLIYLYGLVAIHATTPCAVTCVARHCEDFTKLAYGRWCGPAHATCDDEETVPCDGLDELCRFHAICKRNAGGGVDDREACADAFVKNITSYVRRGGSGFLVDLAKNLPDDMKPNKACYPAAVVETLSAGVQRERTLAAFGNSAKRKASASANSAGRRRAAEAKAKAEEQAKAEAQAKAAEESTTFPADPPTRASSDIPTPKPPPDAAPRRRGITISHDEL